MQYYDFTIDGDRVGYFEIEERPGVLYLNARMLIEGEKQENPFWVRHVDERPIDVRVGGSQWHRVPRGSYPTAAYPFVLRRGISRYTAFIEGSLELEERELRSEAGLVVERSRERIVRRFGVRGQLITYICWGGTAESRLVGARSEAVRGTAFEAPAQGA